jgi:hypothetical protein
MPLNKALVLVGLAKQMAKGSLAANPTFAHGVAGGKVIDYSLKQDLADTTSGNAAPTNVDRIAATGLLGYDTRGYMKTLGLALLGLYGADTVTGTTPSFAHTYGLAAAQPYLSAFESYDGLLRALRDVKISGINIKWKGNEPVVVSVTGQGTVLSAPTTFTPSTDETGSEAFLVPVGGVFQVSASSGTPATARVTEGEIDLKCDTDPVEVSGTLEIDDPGARTRFGATVKLTVIPEDLALWNQSVFGAGAVPPVAASTVYGSFAVTFKDNASATGSLALTGGKVAFLCDYPEADPKGGNAALALVGQAVMSGSTAPIVPVLTNAQATY